MIRIITLEESQLWDSLVMSLPGYDIYYLSGYTRAFRLHGDGEPVLVWYEEGSLRGACVMMIRDVSEDPRFGSLTAGEYFDAVTPYGYGGFIFSEEPTDEQLAVLKEEFSALLKQRRIISAFFRFHPILRNSGYSRGLCEVIDLGKTVSMDISDEETIWSNITSKNRNMIRKAQKSGVEIRHGKDEGLFGRFREIYEATMRDDCAEDYYFFGDEFYRSIHDDLHGNYEMFYAVYEGEIISMAIMLFANGYLNYHLSGSLREYRNLAPGNLLLFEAAKWGCAQGLTSFHLGGGIGSSEDSLYKFKAAFNRNSDNQFSIGKLIVDREKYDYLCSLRSEEAGFDKDSHYFPIYRS